MVDRVIWLGMEGAVNAFRARLRLPPVRMLRGEGGWNIVDAMQVRCLGLI